MAQELVTFKVNNEHVYHKGLGEYSPVSSNNTASGKAKNRRVELLEFSNENDLQRYYNKHNKTLLISKERDRKKQIKKQSSTAGTPNTRNTPKKSTQ